MSVVDRKGTGTALSSADIITTIRPTIAFKIHCFVSVLYYSDLDENCAEKAVTEYTVTYRCYVIEQ